MPLPEFRYPSPYPEIGKHMATTRQIEANRRNSQKSTGPRTAEGKAVSRFNALQSGIHAASLVIPGEDPAELAALTTEYHRQFQPCTSLERFLVDAIVSADWQLRRLRTIEAQLWAKELTPVENVTPSLGEVFDRARDIFTRLQRRMDAAERSYYRALKELQRAQASRQEPLEEPEEFPEDLQLGSFFHFAPPLVPRTPGVSTHVEDSLRADRVPGAVPGDQPVLGPPPR